MSDGTDDSLPDGEASPPDQTLRQTGEIRSSEGRGTAPGLAPFHRVEMERPDGQVVEVGRVKDDEGIEVIGDLLTEIEIGRFPVCPICLTAPPNTAEHVPQKDLGGQVMTSTCHDCNNRLGSRVEPHLLDWYDGSWGRVRFSHDDVPGRRTTGRVFHRADLETGEFHMIIDRQLDPEIRKAMDRGPTEFKMHFVQYDPMFYKVAALKHAYLAACLHLRAVPVSESADQIRQDLLNARDGSGVPQSAIAESLLLARSDAAAIGPTLSLVRVRREGKPDEYGISLAGTMLVGWPFSDVAPADVIAPPATS